MTLVGLSISLLVGVSPSHAKTLILFPSNCFHGFTMEQLEVIFKSKAF